jgi:hypothetical protein
VVVAPAAAAPVATCSPASCLSPRPSGPRPARRVLPCRWHARSGSWSPR